MGFKKLVKDAGLELKVFDLEAMSRLFAVKSGAKGNGALALANDADSLSLGVEQFFTLLVHLAFARDNPRFYSGKDIGFPGDTSVKPPQVPVLQCVQNLMSDYLPKMRKGNAAEFRQVLKGDTEAQGVISSYGEKIGAWIQKLSEKAEKSQSDVYTQFIAYLEEKGCLGVRTLDVTESTGLQVTHKSSLSEIQARHAFLDTQEPEQLAVGKANYELSCIMEALARCGDKKYASIMEMTFATRITSMLKNVLGQATEMEVITEAVGKPEEAGPNEFDEKYKEAQRRNWLVCWKNMTFKDLYGYPLWETQLHDVLQAAFPELQSIFLYYCGNSVAGSESIGNATKIGIMEMLNIVKDTDLVTKEFKVDELTRHFMTANSLEAVKNSGSSERNTIKGLSASRNKVEKDKAALPNDKSAKSARAQDKYAAKTSREDGGTGVDQQLNLFEFINFLVRVALAVQPAVGLQVQQEGPDAGAGVDADPARGVHSAQGEA